MCIFRNDFSSVYDVKNYIFPTSCSAVLKCQPSDFPELVPPLVPHSHPSCHMLGHLSWSSLQTSFPVIFNSTTFDVLHSHYIINTLINWSWMSMGKSVSPLNTNHTVNFPVGHSRILLPLHTNVFYKRHLSVLCHLLHVTPVMRAASYWKIKWFAHQCIL